jgi:hypothetical protein
MEIVDGKIKEYRTDTAKEFWDLLSPEKPLFPPPCKLFYRGQANASWKLEPGLFRLPENRDLVSGPQKEMSADGQIFLELRMIQVFVDHCDSIGLKIPNDSQAFRRENLDLNNSEAFSTFVLGKKLWPNEALFELMALAQHHELPTRLLDWSNRSYVAAYFAASDALAERGKFKDAEDKRFAVWVLDLEKLGLFQNLKLVSVPGSNNANIAAQAGVFTLLQQPIVRPLRFEGTTMLDEYFSEQPTCPLIKVTARLSESASVIDLCEKYGVTAASLFPDYYGAVKATMDARRKWLGFL